MERGYFAATVNGVGVTCGDLPASSTGWLPTQPPSVTQASDCVFQCASGRTAGGTGSSSACNLNAGHFPSSSATNSAGTTCPDVKTPSNAAPKSNPQSPSSPSDCWACDVGYDDHNGDGICAKTAATHYSLANSNDRVACRTVTPPSNAALDTSSKGKGSASDCWSCNEGSTYNGTACVCDEGYTDNGTTCVREAIAIALGINHTCAILSDKTIKCWVGNAGGRNPLSTGEKATAIAAGYKHTCAILDDDENLNNGGPVKCWGENVFGEIGGGTASSVRTISGTAGSPLSGGEKATAIAAGYRHTCAILNDDENLNNGGPVKCWGWNNEGQAGGGTASSVRTISGTAGSPLSPGEKATAIALGEAHTCAILNDDENLNNGGPVKCWGENSSGETGGGSLLSTGEKATAIALGFNGGPAGISCAILDDDENLNDGGPVKCWGVNDSGEIGGKGSLHDSENPKPTISGTVGSPLSTGENTEEKATAIAVSTSDAGAFTCAILSDQSVKCWGSNDRGQTGGGSPLSAGEKATHIAVGHGHGCAILSNKTIKCWGLYKNHGKL